MEELEKIRQSWPFTDIIYFYASLHNKQYLTLAKFEINACIIGLKRQRYLTELLPRLWEKHWKRIPAWLLLAKDKSRIIAGRRAR